MFALEKKIAYKIVVDTMEVDIWDLFLYFEKENGIKVICIYNMGYSNQNCEVKSFKTYTNYLHYQKNIFNTNTKHSNGFLIWNWFQLIKIKLAFHITVHIITNKNYQRNHNHILTILIKISFKGELLDVLLKANKGICVWHLEFTINA
jgi:hypothetical protein